MAFKLEVPFVSQLKYGDGTMNDPTGCWYASACMLAYFYEAGPRFGVPELHTSSIGVEYGHVATGSKEAKLMMNHHGLQAGQEHGLLAEREGLEPVGKCETNHNYTVSELEDILRRKGPVFFYWMKGFGNNKYGHASVIYGVDSQPDVILFHDPENLPDQKMNIARFNERRQKWKYAMMQRKGLGARLKMFGG